MTDLYVAFEPGVLEIDHLLQGRHSSLNIAELDADLSNAAQVVEILLVLHPLDAAICELRQVFFKQELCKIDEHLIFLSAAEAHISISVGRVNRVRWLLSLLRGVHGGS